MPGDDTSLATAVIVHCGDVGDDTKIDEADERFPDDLVKTSVKFGGWADALDEEKEQLQQQLYYGCAATDSCPGDPCGRDGSQRLAMTKEATLEAHLPHSVEAPTVPDDKVGQPTVDHGAFDGDVVFHPRVACCACGAGDNGSILVGRVMMCVQCEGFNFCAHCFDGGGSANTCHPEGHRFKARVGGTMHDAATFIAHWWRMLHHFADLRAVEQDIRGSQAAVQEAALRAPRAGHAEQRRARRPRKRM